MGKGVWRWGGGKREVIYLSLHCHHQNDFCIKVGSDESHSNVSVSANHNLFEETGEPKRYRTEVIPLTSLSLTARPNRLTNTAEIGDDCFYIALFSALEQTHCARLLTSN